MNELREKKERETKKGGKKKHKQTNKTKHPIYIISLVRRLGLDFDTHGRQKDRSLVVITIPIPQSTINMQIHPLQNNIHVSKVH